MKYPYIGKGKSSGSVVLFYGDGFGLTIESKTWATEAGNFESGIDEGYFKNITREYLEGKCVKIESPEHSEQIIMLCKNSGIGEDTHRNKSFAHIENGELYFTDDVPEMDNGDNFEQITIPLPPKESNTSSGECYGRKTDDKWPRVGGKVTWGSCVANAEVIATHNKTAWVLNEHGSYDNVEIAKLKKPKTEAEILRDELESFIAELIDIDYSPGANAEYLLEEMLEKYNITKKHQ